MKTRHNLFLIRRDLKSFFGPLTADEVKAGLRALSFGLQDEVAGHCGPWIALDQIDSLVKYYPEVALVVRGESKNHWHEDTNAKARTLNVGVPLTKAPRRRASKTSSKSTTRGMSRIYWAVGLLSLALSCGLLVAYILKNREEPLPPVADAHVLLMKDDTAEFLGWMDKNILMIANRSLRNKDTLQAWLPYVRAYAFFTSGAVDSWPPKILRSGAPAWMPVDCSVDMWRRKLGESGVDQFAVGQKLLRNPWIKLLALDSGWIRRHSTKNWIKPRNYLEGCLQTAAAALRGMQDATLSKDLLTSIVRRLNVQLEQVQRGSTSGGEKDGYVFFNFLNCLDGATTKQALDACRIELPSNLDAQVLAYADEKVYWSSLRLALPPLKLAAEPSIVEALAKDRTPPEDSLTRMDYTLELKFLQHFRQTQSMERAAQMLEQESQDVQFKN